ncbi:hypothetical protein PR202_gb18994 [Eleusine coracana subsp. coracana]|uniref:Secreted protein n=1 Tax=Eleusine coracana subsp. coracana TaxID=191504 RepID=A0AAV5F4V4_ELECO|nr:hypothetical protein PR202_gb18994 [Eleusine coracana subsp. coracana]
MRSIISVCLLITSRFLSESKNSRVTSWKNTDLSSSALIAATADDRTLSFSCRMRISASLVLFLSMIAFVSIISTSRSANAIDAFAAASSPFTTVSSALSALHSSPASDCRILIVPFSAESSCMAFWSASTFRMACLVSFSFTSSCSLQVASSLAKMSTSSSCSCCVLVLTAGDRFSCVRTMHGNYRFTEWMSRATHVSVWAEPAQPIAPRLEERHCFPHGVQWPGVDLGHRSAPRAIPCTR